MIPTTRQLMNRSLIAALSVAIAVALSPSINAQWPLHPANIPIGPNGKPNLNAPVSRGATGRPDLSGVWMIAAAPDTRQLPFQPWAADLQAKRAAEGGLNDPDGPCMARSPPPDHVGTQPPQI